MCGIAGVINIKGISGKEIQEIENFNRIQKHRGPDDEGIYNDDICALGHVRLSIIDLSSDGHQPFVSDDGRYYLTYNGEIYNYIELREELENKGYTFRTKTDTEVLLKAYIAYGAECLPKFNGMFAFAIYDKEKKEIFAARDRFGVKPFYYLLFNNSFYFSSEIKALKKLKAVAFHINQSALFDYLAFNRTDVFDETFCQEIKRLPKGHFGKFGDKGWHIYEWWNPGNYIKERNEITEDEICRRIEETMVSAVSLRMRSDVPVGSCLSGGLDSSIIVGILYKYFSPANYKTFTASFPGFKLDESNFIELLNKRYPFKNFRTLPTGESALKNLQAFSYHNDEPTTSPTFYSQYEVMRLARENNVTVLLDGQGGDENFAGYHYFHGFNFTGLLRQKKYFSLLSEISKCIIRRQDLEAFETFTFQLLPDAIRERMLLVTMPQIKKDFFYAHKKQSKIYQEFFASQDLNDSIANHFKYKLEHLLRMEDRNSMAFHIETRLPYLDYRLVEFLLGVPARYKIKAGENKAIQKKALGKYTIKEIIERKDKIGFGTPGEAWMKIPAWEKLTRDNYEYVCGIFPEIFRSGAKLKNNLNDKWKINQLAIWHQNNF